MVRLIPSWLREMLRVWVQYFAVALCAFPAGLVNYLLTQWGVNYALSFAVSVSICLVSAFYAWKFLGQHILPSRSEKAISDLVVDTAFSAPPLNWNPYKPLGQVGFLEYKPAADQEIKFIDLRESSVLVDSQLGDIKFQGRAYGIGRAIGNDMRRVRLVVP